MIGYPDHLRTKDTDLLCLLTAVCPEMTQLTALISDFAALLTPASGNDSKLTEWIAQARCAALPQLRSLCNDLELDRAAVNAGLTLPWSNGRTEGVNTHTKRINRQMHGRARFELLRHRILLSTQAPDVTTDYRTEPNVLQSRARGRRGTRHGVWGVCCP